ncbi:pentatricopeptide repeat-containing protein 1, mitochondrial [Patella vulgata]|uniref:pentatricopeptide repeat-containing protein 1, mitochondrial n=1 Tax=Patella vulgata TaxID=6465 RepID=UPI0021803A2C|nr:pentatricopeptide repeat-containing protein 1, mitochondrial [Patella vulgata]
MANIHSYMCMKALTQGLKLLNQLQTRCVWTLSKGCNIHHKPIYSLSTSRNHSTEETPGLPQSQSSDFEDKSPSGTRPLFHKLHNRTLTADEEENNREFRNVKLYSNDDEFGSGNRQTFDNKILHRRFRNQIQREIGLEHEHKNSIELDNDGDEFGNHRQTHDRQLKKNKREHYYDSNYQRHNKDDKGIRNFTTPQNNMRFGNRFRGINEDGDNIQDINLDSFNETNIHEQFNKFTNQKDSINLKNKFGTLNEENEEIELNSVDEFEELRNDKPHVRLSSDDRRNVPYWYGRQIEKLGKQGKIDEAIAVLEDWMLKRDRVKPTNYNFSVLMGVLARNGETKKAFKVFNKMKKMGLVPDAVTYTALFNACANSPSKQDGLQRAKNLHELMKESDWHPNLITGRAMIKAYGFCGDLPAAFAVMDEIAERYPLDQRCISSLLMACISEKENGVKLASEVWQMMIQHGVQPDLPIYNLLLRVIRDCGVGHDFTQIEAGSMKDYPHITETGTSWNLVSTVEDSQTFQNTSENSTSMKNKEESDKETVRNMSENSLRTLPTNFMVHRVDFNLLSNVDFSERANRMALIGGRENFLDHMVNSGAKPDIKTFALLLDNTFQTLEEEDRLLMIMENYGVHPDQEFYNTLMRKRCLRKDFDGAKIMLRKMTSHNLQPNMETFEIIAITCRKQADGLQLLKTIEDIGGQPSRKIFTSLMRCSGVNFYYKLDLINRMENLNLQPDSHLLQHIERDVKRGKNLIVEMESGRREKQSLSFLTGGINKFIVYYTSWLKRCQVSGFDEV